MNLGHTREFLAEATFRVLYGLLRVVQVINVERPGISAYVSCARDGTIKFWHKATFAPFRTIRHLDAMKAACGVLIMASDALWHLIFLVFLGFFYEGRFAYRKQQGSAHKYGNSRLSNPKTRKCTY